jgi:hypothetical protein
MKLIKSTLAIIVVCFLVFYSCTQNNRFDSIEFKDLLSERIKSKINNKNRVEIKIRDLTNFKWDTFFVISPYSKISTLEDNLKIDLKIMDKIQIEKRDDITILVFLEHGKVVKFIEYPRWPGDFSELGEVKFYYPNDAFFEVEEVNRLTSNGKKWLLIKKVDSH